MLWKSEWKEWSSITSTFLTVVGSMKSCDPPTIPAIPNNRARICRSYCKDLRQNPRQWPEIREGSPHISAIDQGKRGAGWALLHFGFVIGSTESPGLRRSPVT